MAYPQHTSFADRYDEWAQADQIAFSLEEELVAELHVRGWHVTGAQTDDGFACYVVDPARVGHPIPHLSLEEARRCADVGTRGWRAAWESFQRSRPFGQAALFTFPPRPGVLPPEDLSTLDDDARTQLVACMRAEARISATTPAASAPDAPTLPDAPPQDGADTDGAGVRAMPHAASEEGDSHGDAAPQAGTESRDAREARRRAHRAQLRARAIRQGA